jgi:hypothetical protein
MANLTLRQAKGSPLTFAEVDGNFTALNNELATATSANTASTPVKRDSSGNFSAGTITAALTGAASANVLKAGDTMTGALGVPLGSASAPSIYPGTDTNTGIYSPGADQVAISTNGTGRLFVNAAGDVGINTTANISAWGGSTGQKGLHIKGDSSNKYSLIKLEDDLGAAFWISSPAGSADDSAYLWLDSANSIVHATNATERLRIDSSGRLLVGTSTANGTAKLQVDGDALVRSINGGPLAGFRNAIINGNFDHWQRGTSFTNPGSGNGFTADRWVPAYNGTGATRVISREAFTPGQTGVPGEPAYYFRWNQTVAGSGGTFNDLLHRIEGVRSFAGQTVTLSFYAKAAAATTLPNANYIQNFGTGGSPSASVQNTIATNLALTTVWQKFAYSFSVPSVSGKVLGSDGNDILIIAIRMPLNATFTVDIAQVQVEPGPVATTFERRPIGTELALCQRYFNKSYDVSVDPGTITDVGRCYFSFPTTGTGSFGVPIFYPTTMRAAPSVTIYNPVTGASGGARRGSTNKTGVSASNIGTTVFNFEIPGTEDVDNGSFHYTASAEL